MSLSRRKMLGVVGGGFILAAGGAGGFYLTREPKNALAPWEAAGHYEDPRRRALSYAILAPNPHNRQPWLVDLSQPDQVHLYRDPDRDLPETDPHHRQLTIGLGCFLEVMRVAAAEAGIAAEITPFPEGENGPVAIAHFQEGAQKDPLFHHILQRRSCKEPFEDRQIPAEAAPALAALAAIVTDPDRVSEIRALTLESWLVEMSTERTLKESVELMRFGKTEINRSPDGIDLGGPFLETLMLFGMLTRDGQLDPDSAGFQEGVRMYQEMLSATPAYAVVTTKGNDRLAQLDAGRRWVRLNLETTRFGLALHPVSQALQEFPEMSDHYRRVHALLAPDGGTVQMLGRLGYGPAVPRSPRWPLETRIRNG
ncbi:hypothetical protein [Nisaea sp.]|uniref:Acg family FMN-binding oxidoreductase n=1 Tax=Nisaea sp. TaxID=2024842 RepID=UPI003298BD4C